MKTQHKLSALMLAVVSIAAAGMVQAQEAPFLGESSNTSYVKVGKSDVNVPPIHNLGFAGISVQSTGIDKQVDFKGLAAFTTKYTGAGALYGYTVHTLDFPYTGAPDSHDNLGVFAFAQVGTRDLWFGEWSTNGNVTNGTHTVYYVGDTTGTTVPTAGVAIYDVVGINNSGSGSALTGVFIANFALNRLQGKIERTGSSTINRLTLGNNLDETVGYVTINPATATISGSAIANTDTANLGSVSGRFYGANAAALAGIATFGGNGSKDVAFGGRK